MFTLEEISAAVNAIVGPLPIDLLYIHGSYALGKQDKESDLDLAFLTSKGVSLEKRRRLRLDLQAYMFKSLGEHCPELDVVSLPDVPILLQFNIIRKGKVIYERTPGIKIDYELSTEQKYDDEFPALERETEMILDRILSKKS